MNNSIIIELIQNIAILLAFSMIYDYSWVKKESKSITRKILTGTIIGGVGIILMVTPWTLLPGIVFDTRSVLLSITGLFFGAIPTITAILITGLYRIILGGDGVYMGVMVIISSGTIGILWKVIRPNWKVRNYRTELLLMGFLVHLVMLGCTIFLPKDHALLTFKNIAVPVLIIYPAGTMLLGILMLNQLKNWQNRKAQIKLIESERRFTDLMENVKLLSVILDHKANITFCNNHLLEITGYQQHEIIGKNWIDLFILPDMHTEIHQVFNRIVNNEKFSPNYENSILKKDGTELLIAWNNTILRDAEGTIIGIAGIGENITEKRLAEDEKLKFANIINASLNEIYLFDAKTFRYKYTNYGALKNRGYTYDEIMRLTPFDLSPEFNFDNINQLVSPLINHEKSVIIFETHHKRADGSIYPVEVHLQLFEYPTESFYLAISQDITKRKIIKQQLLEAKQKAEESDKLKSIFLANMSHEIRTPMNAIMGFSSLLIDPELTDREKQQYVDIIRNSGDRLLQIINDIIDISKLEAKQMTIKLDVCNLYNIVSNSIKTFKKSDLLAAKPQVKIVSKLSDLNKLTNIISDNNRLQQVIDNLISNAIKYTKEGTIEVGLISKDDVVEIFITDSGIGIAENKKNLIFERFRQIEEDFYHEGAGLGLSICKGIIDLLGGEIGFTSTLNKGTTFYVQLPLNQTKENITHKSGDTAYCI